MTTVACYSTLRHSFDHLYPIAEELRLRGVNCPIYSGWARAEWARYTSNPHSLGIDLWIVASSSDAKAVSPAKVVYVERGAGQTYDGDDRSAGCDQWSTGHIPNARLFLCPNRFVAQRRQNRHDEESIAIVVGCPKLDQHAEEVGWHSEVEPNVAAFCWHWDQKMIPETRSAWDHYFPELRRIALALHRLGIRGVMNAHPRIASTVRYHSERAGFEWWNPEEILTRASVLVADNTSMIFEFATVDRPIVMLNAPWYRKHVSHGLRFWECQPGRMIDHPADVANAVREGLEWGGWGPDDPMAERRRWCADVTFPNRDGKAAARSAEAISLLL